MKQKIKKTKKTTKNRKKMKILIIETTIKNQ